MSHAVITAILLAFVLVASEWLGKRRQEVITRVVVLMGLVIYVLWRFAPS
jgi:uncharacterized membrane protein YhfC